MPVSLEYFMREREAGLYDGEWTLGDNFGHSLETVLGYRGFRGSMAPAPRHVHLQIGVSI